MGIAVLGPMTAAGEQGLTPRDRVVLAALAVRPGEVLSWEQLADALWGSDPPASWAKIVQGCILRLRRVLGRDAVETVAGGYRLTLAAEEIDACRFERCVARGHLLADGQEYEEAAGAFREALAIWRGPPFADLEHWPPGRVEVARLSELRLGAQESLVETELHAGHDVAAAASALADEEPLRERRWWLVALALYRTGRQGEALAALRRARRILGDELGVDPGPELRDLEQAILAHDPGLTMLVSDGGRRWDGRSADPSQSPSGNTAALDALPPSPVPSSLSPRRVRRTPRRLMLAGAAVALALASAGAVVGEWDRGGSKELVGNALGLIDAASVAVDAVTGALPVPSAVAADREGAWVVSASTNSVYRVDATTRQVRQTIAVGSEPEAMAVWGPDVWVVNTGDDTVTRINSRLQQVVGRPIPVGDSPDAVLAVADGAYVADAADGTVVHIDAATDSVDAHFPVGSRPSALALGFQSLWVADSAGNFVARLDPHTGVVQQPYPVGVGPVALLIAGQAVWVANSLDATVSRIDPGTGQVLTLPAGDGPSGLAYSGGKIWVTGSNDGTLTGIDPTSGTVSSTHFGSRLVALASAGSRLWVAGRAFPSGVHRGGTLTVFGGGAGTSFDPALVYYGPAINVLSLVYDGLVAVRPAAGAAGYQLVPDLATGLPHPSLDGRTYTFYVRRGIHFSDGQVLEPEDFRRAIQRALILAPTGGGSGNAAYYRGIIGASDCRVGQPQTCSLTEGITTDENTYTVAFHLTAPDPDFLGKLAMLFAAAVPPEAPWHEVTGPTLAGTGPYRVTSADPVSGRLTLTRNPLFHPWSLTAQPDGFPERIVEVAPPEGADQATGELDAVRNGSVDLAEFDFGELPAEAFTRFQLSDPGRVLSTPSAVVFTLYLNNHRPPFDDVHARRAVNYAVDRAAAARFLGAGDPACQVVPPGFPGYAPICTFTAHPGESARWQGPDLAAAAAEMHRAKPYRGTLSVYTLSLTTWRATATTVVNTLRKLGYRAVLRVVDNDYFTLVPGPRSPSNVALWGWGADYPTESQYYEPILSCHAHAENSDGYCNPHLDQLMHAAEAAQASGDPIEAHKLWTSLYRQLDAAAPLTPLAYLPRQVLLSPRVKNATFNRLHGPLLDQIWVK